MVKITLDVEGMACEMCEAHINEAVRKSFEVKKVTSSHRKGKTEIVAEQELDEDALRNAVEETGYRVRSIQTEPYTRKGFLFFGKG